MLNNVENVKSILRNNHLIGNVFPLVRIASHQTPIQRINELREALKKEENLTIKYVRGVPKIVPVRLKTKLITKVNSFATGLKQQ